MPEFISQRRRWLNGAFFAAVYSLVHFKQIWNTDHTVARKVLLHIEFVYQFLQLLFTFFSLANFYLAFFFLVSSATKDSTNDPFGFMATGAGKTVFEVILKLYIALLFVVLVCSLGNRPQVCRLCNRREEGKLIGRRRVRSGRISSASCSLGSVTSLRCGALRIPCIWPCHTRLPAGQTSPSTHFVHPIQSAPLISDFTVSSPRTRRSAKSSSHWRPPMAYTSLRRSCTSSRGICSRASCNTSSSCRLVSGIVPSSWRIVNADGPPRREHSK